MGLRDALLPAVREELVANMKSNDVLHVVEVATSADRLVTETYWQALLVAASLEPTSTHPDSSMGYYYLACRINCGSQNRDIATVKWYRFRRLCSSCQLNGNQIRFMPDPPMSCFRWMELHSSFSPTHYDKKHPPVNPMNAFLSEISLQDVLTQKTYDDYMEYEEFDLLDYTRNYQQGGSTNIDFDSLVDLVENADITPLKEDLYSLNLICRMDHRGSLPTYLPVSWGFVHRCKSVFGSNLQVLSAIAFKGDLGLNNEVTVNISGVVNGATITIVLYPETINREENGKKSDTVNRFENGYVRKDGHVFVRTSKFCPLPVYR